MWEKAGKVYMKGYEYWRGIGPDSTDEEYIMRKEAYERLCEDPYSIYSMPFDFDLKLKSNDE